MKRNEISILQQRRKRKMGAVAYKKKIRSKIPRRKRFQISPILSRSSNLLFSDNKPGFSAFAEASSSSSCFPNEISCTSSWISVGYEKLKKKQRSSRQKRNFQETGRSEVEFGVDDRSVCQLDKSTEEERRRITRSYHRQTENKKTVENEGLDDVGLELSESSCLESVCGVDNRFLSKTDEVPERNLKMKTGSGNGVSKAGEGEGNAASAVTSLSESSCVHTSPQEKLRSFCKPGEFSEKLCTERDKGAGSSHGIRMNESISEISCLESLAEVRNQNLYLPAADNSFVKTTDKNRGPVSEVSEIPRNQVAMILAVSNSKSNLDCDVELGCLENLSSEDDSYSSTSDEMTISDLESELFPTNSEGEFSDNCPWLRVESPSDFSERSYGSSSPSPCFSLFTQFSQQFSKTSSHPHGKGSSRVEDENLDEFTLRRFENVEDEESYRNFRHRERRQNFLHDYTEDYYSTTEYGELVLQQRLLMVNWIVEQSNVKELQSETMFLGVNLLDRFLSEGFFKQERNLQLVGIACLTLATRIEENQPLNCVRQKVFHVGSTVYSSCEVVAMEWLVQEVLDFRCFLPTTYNFLWFYLKAAKADAEVEKRAKHLAVLSMLDHSHLCFWPSTVAAALVILASLAGNHDSSCQWVMEVFRILLKRMQSSFPNLDKFSYGVHAPTFLLILVIIATQSPTHVRTKKDDLSECIQSLEWLVKYVC